MNGVYLGYIFSSHEIRIVVRIRIGFNQNIVILFCFYDFPLIVSSIFVLFFFSFEFLASHNALYSCVVHSARMLSLAHCSIYNWFVFAELQQNLRFIHCLFTIYNEFEFETNERRKKTDFSVLQHDRILVSCAAASLICVSSSSSSDSSFFVFMLLLDCCIIVCFGAWLQYHFECSNHTYLFSFLETFKQRSQHINIYL